MFGAHQRILFPDIHKERRTHLCASSPHDGVPVFTLVAYKAHPKEPVIVVPLLRDFVPERTSARRLLFECAVDESGAVCGIGQGRRDLREVRKGVQRAVEPQHPKPFNVDALLGKTLGDALPETVSAVL